MKKSSFSHEQNFISHEFANLGDALISYKIFNCETKSYE